MSRKIEDLVPALRAKYAIFEFRMWDAGIDFLITCTRRTPEEQKALWDQGRTKPGRVVTWTLKSKHLTGEAFDFVVMENGKPDWQVTNPKWTKAGKIAEDVGLVWGGNFTHVDYPHVELKESV